jgi:hypothetical protein
MMIARPAAVLLALAPAAVLAESVASSAASSASVTASSASESLGASSNSSKSGGNTARAGDYRIDAVAAAEYPGKVRVVLEPLAAAADGGGFVLTLPQAALDAQRLARGDTVRVRERAYGFEFARADSGEAFFLVLADAWLRELDPRPVGDAAARTAL